MGDAWLGALTLVCEGDKVCVRTGDVLGQC